MEGERVRVIASTVPFTSIAGLSIGPDIVRERQEGNRI